MKHLLHKYYIHKASFFMTYYLVPLLKFWVNHFPVRYVVVLGALFLIDTNFFETSVIIRHHATIFSTIDEDRLGLRMKEGDATRHLGAPCFRWLRRKSRRTLGLNSFEIAFTFQTFNVLWSRKYHMLHQFMKRKSRLNAIYVTTPVV